MGFLYLGPKRSMVSFKYGGWKYKNIQTSFLFILAWFRLKFLRYDKGSREKKGKIHLFQSEKPCWIYQLHPIVYALLDRLCQCYKTRTRTDEFELWGKQDIKRKRSHFHIFTRPIWSLPYQIRLFKIPKNRATNNIIRYKIAATLRIYTLTFKVERGRWVTYIYFQAFCLFCVFSIHCSYACWRHIGLR